MLKKWSERSVSAWSRLHSLVIMKISVIEVASFSNHNWLETRSLSKFRASKLRFRFICTKNVHNKNIYPPSKEVLDKKFIRKSNRLETPLVKPDAYHMANVFSTDVKMRSCLLRFRQYIKSVIVSCHTSHYTCSNSPFSFQSPSPLIYLPFYHIIFVIP